MEWGELGHLRRQLPENKKAININVAKLPSGPSLPLLTALYIKEIIKNMHKDLHARMLIITE